MPIPSPIPTLESIFAPFLSQDCQLCGLTTPAVLCANCDSELPRRKQSGCANCGLPNIEGVCGACLAHPPAFDHTVIAFEYDFPIDQLLQDFKFNANFGLVAVLARGLLQPIQHRGAPLPDLLIPVPLAAQRLALRGFNQSALIAGELARCLSLPMDIRSLKRVRETAAQSGLAGAARFANVKGAFHCDATLTGRRVALIDDVMTTGATLSAAAAALKAQGAAMVAAWVVARVNLTTKRAAKTK